jgi:hypothetical protein
MNQEVMWTNRYKDVGDQYLFGKDPNKYLANRIKLFEKNQTVLSLADGEGRNSVWLAQQGLNVTTIEISPVAVQKAQQLAIERNVNITTIQSDMLMHDWQTTNPNFRFHWVLGIFIQFAGPDARAQQFRIMKNLTCQGGKVMLHGYTPKQLDYRTGGPSDINNLYTKEMLIEAFADWYIEEIVEYEDEIAEGIGHKGQSALIGLIARKP